MDQHNRANNR
jgi:exonuclease III